MQSAHTIHVIGLVAPVDAMKTEGSRAEAGAVRTTLSTKAAAATEQKAAATEQEAAAVKVEEEATREEAEQAMAVAAEAARAVVAMA